ncbi:MAG: YveK family protein [Clostridia bacterium]
MNEQISIIEIFKLFLFYWWRIALTAIAGAVIAYCISSYYIMPTYTSRGSLYINNNSIKNSQNVNLSDLATSQQLAFTCIELLTSDTYLSQIQEYTGLPYTAQQIKSMVVLNSLNETEIIEIKASTYYPEHSQIIVDAILNNASDEIIRVVGGGNIKVVDAATFPLHPSSPNIPRNVIIGFAIGGLFSMVLIFLLDVFDGRIKIEADLMEVKELPLLGVIPDIEYIRAEEKKNGRK